MSSLPGIGDLGPGERIALEERLARAMRTIPGPPPIPPWSPDKPVPATSAQAGVWFLSQLEPAGRSYRIPVALRLRGHVDEAALREAIRGIVQRHEPLRTVLRAEGGQLWQHVRPDSADSPLRTVEPAPPPGGWSGAAVAALAADEASREFDLAVGPLFRAALYRLGDDDHLLVCCMHHAVGDAWSVTVLCRELGVLYGQFSRGRPADLPDLAVRYGDYAAWRSGRPEDDAALDYWRERLRGAPDHLRMPTDHARPRRRSHRGGRVTGLLGPRLATALRGLATASGGTLFDVLLGGYATLLHRHTADDDIVIGTPVADRGRTELHGLIGLFVNTLPIRVDLSGGPSSLDLLNRVHRARVEDLAHDVPFERIVAAVTPRHDTGRTPVFQTLFAWQNLPTTRLRFGDVSVTPVAVDTKSAKFDLTLHATPIDAGIRLTLEYSQDLFERVTAEELIRQLTTLLESTVADPGTVVAVVSLHAPSQAARMLAERSTGDVREISTDGVHDLVAAQAARTPDATAIRFGADTLTYAGLDQASNRMANHLLALGLRPETVVAVALRRGFDLVIALLGILKAGGAYLPIDPATPPERVRRLVRDSGANFLVATQELMDRLGGLRSCTGIPVDRDTQLPRRSTEPPPVRVDPGSLAYVIYTSGSTGNPKGVMIEHRGLTNHVLWAVERFRLDAGGGSVLHMSLAFDLAVPNLYAPLVAAGAVVLAAEDGPEALAGAREIAAGGHSFLKFTPSHLRLLAAELGADGLAGAAACLVVAGEELRDPSLIPVGPLVINEYGPTEVSVACCAYDVPRRSTPWPGGVPIGGPIWNTTVYLLDAGLRPVPIGVVGEIYVGGQGVARGYLGRPDLTAARFRPDPFGPMPGARMYRTGDLARYDREGMLVFVGRTDDQAKVRGFRIEPAEIEAALRECPGVREAAAVAMPDEGITAFVAPAAAELSSRELDSWLSDRLPAHLVPDRYLVVDQLPLTGNGKIDRRALARIRGSAPAMSGGRPLTGSPTQRTLADIWQRVLGTTPTGIDDDFFGLGGHSLHALAVAEEIAGAFDVRCPLRVIFEAPRLQELAERVDRLVANGGDDESDVA